MAKINSSVKKDVCHEICTKLGGGEDQVPNSLNKRSEGEKLVRKTTSFTLSSASTLHMFTLHFYFEMQILRAAFLVLDWYPSLPSLGALYIYDSATAPQSQLDPQYVLCNPPSPLLPSIANLKRSLSNSKNIIFDPEKYRLNCWEI